MHGTSTFAPARHQAARLEASSGSAKASRRHDSWATLRSIIATWRWRIRYRRELAQRSTDDPHLIEDIGLTKPELDAEIAKPFWQR